MPIFEFMCDHCGVFEDLVSNNEEIHSCPDCGRKVEKIMSVPGGFILNGHGFYTNDYKKMEKGDARKWPGDEKKNSGNNIAKIPTTNIYEQFDKRRTEERRTTKQKDWKFIAK